MKVLLISPVFSGHGAARVGRELFVNLPGAGVGAEMLVAHRRPSDPPGVRAVRLPWEKYLRALEWVVGPPVDVRHVGSIRALAGIRPGTFDLVHLHNLHGGYLSAKAVRRLFRRMPSVWSFHDAWPITGGLAHDFSSLFTLDEVRRRFPDAPWHLHKDEPGVARMVARNRRWMPKPGAIISPSQWLADEARASPQFAGVPVFVIRHGVRMLELPEASADRQAARRRFGLPAEAKVILLIAADIASPFKGIPLAIEAVGRLAAADPRWARDARVLLVGNAPPGLAERLQLPVVPAGFIGDDPTLALAYRAADVTVVPSVADSSSYVALESLACGTPVTSFRIPGLVEILGEEDTRGLVADAFDTAQMADNLRRLLDDRDLNARLGTAGHAWTAQHCRLDDHVRQTIEVYRGTLDRRGARPIAGRTTSA